MLTQARPIIAYVRRRFAVAAGMTMALVIAACATTELKEQWRDPDYRADSGQRVLIVAVTSRDDRRRMFEDQFAARLREEGVDAIPSYSQLSVIGPENLDAVKAVVQRNAATMVLSVRLVQVDQRTAVSGGHPGYYGSAGFYSYYPNAWAGAYSPPSTYTYRTYTTETRVFDMKSDKLVWAATLQSEEPSDFTAAAAQYADLVVKQMRDNKILGGG